MVNIYGGGESDPPDVTYHGGGGCLRMLGYKCGRASNEGGQNHGVRGRRLWVLVVGAEETEFQGRVLKRNLKWVASERLA